jgi:hypothetical protein
MIIDLERHPQDLGDVYKTSWSRILRAYNIAIEGLNRRIILKYIFFKTERQARLVKVWASRQAKPLADQFNCPRTATGIDRTLRQ